MATTYYVRADGDDSKDGLSDANAWKTISKVNSSMGSFSGGDFIGFKRGDVWDGTLSDCLKITASGSSGSIITFGAYGSGADPILNGANVLTTWVVADDVSDDNCLSNGGFSSDTSSWTAERSATLTSVSGGQSGNCLEIKENGNSNPRAKQSITKGVTPGDSLTLTFYVKAGTEATWRVWVHDVTHATELYDSTNNEATGSWVQQNSGSFTIPSGCEEISVTLQQTCDLDAKTTIYFDEVVVYNNAIFKKDVTNTPYVCVEDDTFLDYLGWDTDTQTTFDGESSGCWANDGTVCYVRCTDDADPDTHTMEVGNKTGDDQHCIYGLNVSYVTVEDIKCQYSTQEAIYFYTSSGTDSDITVQNCTVFISGDSCIEVKSVNTGTYQNITNARIYNCDVSYSRRHGLIFVNGTSDSKMDYNTAHHCGWGGTGVGGTGGHNISHWSANTTANTRNNVLEYNESYSCYIATDGTEGTGIQLDDNSQACTVRYNLSYNNEGPAYNDNGYKDNKWYYNIGYGSGSASATQFVGGFMASQPNGLKVWNNVFYDNEPCGIGIFGTSVSYELKNNILSENDTYEIKIAVAAKTGIDSDYNCVYHSAGGSFMYWGADKTWVTWKSDSSQDSNSKNEDPKFVDVSSHDFHIKSTSPCRNAGTSVSLTQDYDGVTVPVETYPCIGAYEFYTEEGEISVSATLTGDLTIFTGIQDLQGTISSSALLEADLTAIISLISEITASSTITADTLKVIRGLDASISSSATLTGALKKLKYLVGLIQSTSGISGDFKALKEIAGSISAAALFTAILTIPDQSATVAPTTTPFDEFIKLTDSFKTFLVEINKAEEIEDYTWTQDSTYTNCYYTTYTTGFPNKITEDDTTYVERFTLSECNTNAESFYYDLVNQKLYLHTVGSDDPGSMTGNDYDYKIIAYSWTYLCNDNSEDFPTIFTREQELIDNYSFDIWDDSTTLNGWTNFTAGSSTVNRESSNVYHEGYSVKLDIDASNNDAVIYKSFIIEPGAKCKLSFWYSNSDTGKTAKIRFRDSGTNVYLDSNGDWATSSTDIQLTNSSGEWTKYEIEFYAHTDYTNYVLQFRNDSAADSKIYFDKPSLLMYREDNYYYPYLQSASMPILRQSVSDYHIGSIELNFGTLRFINDGWWYSAVQDYLWNNKKLIVRYGRRDSLYSDFGVVFEGRTRKPKVSDTFSSLQVTDMRTLAYKEIPATKYWTSNYPNLKDGFEGFPIPIIYGQVSGCLPTCIDTSTYKFKISVHALESIDAVYKDGTLLTVTTDYTVDLANGEFTLTADPEEAVITCDVKGKKCDMEDGTYSQNVADILYDLLVNYVEIDKEKIDYGSFLDLRNARTQSHMLYIDVAATAMETIRKLQASALFHLIPLADGRIGAFRYSTGIDSDTLRVIDEEWINFAIEKTTSSVYSKVKVHYNRNPEDFSYDIIERTNDNVERKYGVNRTFNLYSSLRVKSEAENIGDFYIDLFKDPMRKVSGNLPTKLFKLRPAEKLVVNKTREDRDGNTIAVLDEEPYRVLVLAKSFQTGRVDIEAWEDLQSAGETYCEVCYDCQTCFSTQTGSCSTCYTCEKCDYGECDTCQSCYYCEKCNTGECSSCESCDSCQTCNTCEATQCSSCNTCQLCNVCQNSECNSCQTCDTCQKCYTCMNGECSSCQNCITCEKCNTGECSSCESCDSCQTCNTCENCVNCQSCFGIYVP